ncbi:putative nucleic acid-binding Zn ribbon protein [Aeromicrobium panaciterrae]|uniref:Nucleic acid-binding Zn ribbon protein n=1 Tax=Aeromicrobium panaciterrae TaxID=363861 RepID=A0ABU1UK20_9ACTN|nr:DciA family protein [Aeromicrobium panaciterrae]MDR7085513.1 putative nucleic acid-binding Zn ribbon protein [Aeromicrobium panaciterrae]
MTEPEEQDALRLAREIANSYRGAKQTGQNAKRKSRPSKPARPNRDEPSALSDVLGELVENQGWTEKLASQRVFTDWPKIVGAEVAQHSEVIAFEDGEVEVRTDSTAWATQLRMLAPRIVAKLNEEFGDGSVLRIVVRGPQAPSWKKGLRSVKGARGPRDTYG